MKTHGKCGRLLAALLVLCMIVSMLPMAVFAEGETADTSGVSAAILHDTREATAGGIADDDLVKDYGVTVADGDDGVKVITLTGTDLRRHRNGDDPANMGYWAGVAIEAPEDAVKMKAVAKLAKGSLAEAFAAATARDLIANVNTAGKDGFVQYLDVKSDAYKNADGKFYIKLQWLGAEDAAIGEAVTYEVNFGGITVAAPRIAEVAYAHTGDAANEKAGEMKKALGLTGAAPTDSDQDTLCIGLSDLNPAKTYTTKLKVGDEYLTCRDQETVGQIDVGPFENGAAVLRVTLNPTNPAENGAWLYTGDTKPTAANSWANLYTTVPGTYTVELYEENSSTAVTTKTISIGAVEFKNGDAVLETKYATVGQKVTAPAAPTPPTGQIFKGWKNSTDTTDTTLVAAGAEITVETAAKVTYTADFAERPDPVVTIDTATLHDTSGAVADDALYATYSVAQPDQDNKIVVTATDVRLHKNADTTPAYGHWTGVKFTAPDGYTVKYKNLDDKGGDWAVDAGTEGKFVALYSDKGTERKITIGLFEGDGTEPVAGTEKAYTIDFKGVTAKEVTATLNYSPVADTTIVPDCAPETMWVQFDEPVNPSSSLWFEITAPDGTVYGIAASTQELATGKLPTKQAWSFQNKGQFDAWPKDKDGEDVALGAQTGDYKVTAYLVAGTTPPTEKPATGLTVLFEKTVAVTAVPAGVTITAPAAPAVDTGDGIKAEEKDAVVSALQNVSAANTVLQNATVAAASATSTKDAYSAENANKALADAKLPQGTEQSPVKIVYKPYLDVKATAYDSAAKTLTVNITPMCYVLATTVDANSVELTFGAQAGNNAVQLGSEELTVDQPIEMAIGLPVGFVEKVDAAYPNVYVQHKGYEYTATVDAVLAEDGTTVEALTATFTNPHGFSEFTVTKSSAAVAKIGDVTYTSVKDAIEAAATGDTIIILKKLEGADATISATLSANKELTFKVLNPEIATELTINGTKVTPTEAGVTVTLNKTGGGSSNPGGSSGGSSNKPTTPTKPTNPTQFVDVPAGAYYTDAVKWAVEKGITTGMTDTTFAPNGDCTRAQMVTFLWRAAGSPKAEGENPFTDVAAGAYYYDAVLWAVSKGITNGTSAATFSPDATVSRAQTVTFLHRYAGAPEASGNSFTDVTAGSYYEGAVDWAVAEGVTQGTSDTTFSPDADCVRAQIVTFLYRYMVK